MYSGLPLAVTASQIARRWALQPGKSHGRPTGRREGINGEVCRQKARAEGRAIGTGPPPWQPGSGRASGATLDWGTVTLVTGMPFMPGHLW